MSGVMRNKEMKHFLAIFLAAILSGCQSNPDIKIDPNQKILFGTVESKRIEKDPELLRNAQADYEADRTARAVQYSTQYGDGSFAGGAAAVIVISLLDAEFGDGPTMPIEPVSYFVASENGQRYQIISNYRGFAVGDCVKLFLSENPEQYPPRMAYGSKCSGSA